MRRVGRVRAVLLVGLVLALGGCFTADVTLNADGSGTLQVKYDPMWPTTEQRERAAFQGSGLTVQEIKLGEIRAAGPQGIKVPAWVEAKVAFTSVAALAQAQRLWRFQLELADAGEGLKRLTVALKAKESREALPAEGDATLRVNLPGDVVESSAKIEGRSVVWKFPTKDFFTKPGLKMTATYKVPAGASGGAGTAAPAAGTTPAPATGAPAAAPAEKTATPSGHAQP
jgi:hypothetical protein